MYMFWLSVTCEILTKVNLTVMRIFSICFISLSPFQSSMFTRHTLRRVFQSYSSKSCISTFNVAFLGTPSFAADSLQMLLDCQSTLNFNICAVITQPPGTGKQKHGTPVHLLAERKRLKLFTPPVANDINFLEELEKMNIDLCITAAYGSYLPKRFLSIPKFGTINIHPSLLPRYRGAAPIPRCLENGDEETGVSILYTVQKMDAGPILDQVKIPLGGNEKSGELLNRTFRIGTEMIISMLPSIFNGSVKYHEQDHSKATIASKISVEEGYIDFSKMSAKAIHSKCRAFSVWPGIYTFLKIGSKIMRCKLITTELPPPTEASAAPGDVKVELEKLDKHRSLIKITCGDGSVLHVKDIQVGASRAVTARDFVNGIRGQDFSVEWMCQPPVV